MMNQEARNHFLSALAQSKIEAGLAPMGTIGQHFYAGAGAERWASVADSPNYLVSRASADLAETVAQDIMRHVPEGAELCLLGTSLREAIAFASATKEKLRQVTIVDIAQSIAQEQAQALQECMPGVRVEPLCISFDEMALGGGQDAARRVIVYPSANIGNTPGFLGRPVTENAGVINLLKRFRENASMLIVGYDTTQDSDLLDVCYAGPAHDAFVVGGVVDLGASLGCQMDAQALERRSFWHPQSGAYIHRVVCREEQIITLGDHEIALPEGHSIYAGHSYKFRSPSNENEGDMQVLARRTGWKPLGEPLTQDGRMVVQPLTLAAGA